MLMFNLLTTRRALFGLATALLIFRMGLSQEASVTKDFVGPVRIAKLLWKANPKNAASTLTKALETGFERSQVMDLKSALEPLGSAAVDVVGKSDVSDPRYAPSLVVMALLEHDALPELQSTLPKLINAQDHELVYRVWHLVDSAAAMKYFAQTIGNTHQDMGLSIALTRRALQADTIAATKILLQQWSAIPVELKLAAIEPMSSSAGAMGILADAVAEGVVNKDLINTNQLRKWMATENTELKGKIEQVWGTIRESDNAERQALVAQTVALLRSGASGSVGRGDKVFERVCSQCHQLHGKGFEVGPNITGNGRGNLDQLVSNVLDPSLVIGEAFQAKIILTYDGEVVSGLVAAEDERYLKIKVQGGKILEFDKEEDIEQIKTSPKSLMPEGLETQLTQQELIDLFAYLSLLKPLGADDNELIPGTPDTLVEP